MIQEQAWRNSQAIENEYNNNRFKTFQEGEVFFKEHYKKIFELTGINADLKGKTIAEVGSGSFPALYYCQNLGDKCWVFEPNSTGFLVKSTQNKNINLVPS